MKIQSKKMKYKANFNLFMQIISKHYTNKIVVYNIILYKKPFLQ